MHREYAILAVHGDVSRLELEDGLIRNGISELLATESTIAEVVIDIARGRLFDMGVDASTLHHPTIRIDAQSTDDAVVDLGSLVAQVATVRESWPATVVEVVSPARTWPGTATPGVKMRFDVTGAGGIDAASFASWVDEIARETVERLDNPTTAEIVRPADSAASARAIVSFGLATDAALDDAVASDAFAGFCRSELIEPSSLVVDAVTEHRIRPNPNTWTVM